MTSVGLGKMFRTLEN